MAVTWPSGLQSAEMFAYYMLQIGKVQRALRDCRKEEGRVRVASSQITQENNCMPASAVRLGGSVWIEGEPQPERLCAP
jgi:hypothetical protein